MARITQPDQLGADATEQDVEQFNAAVDYLAATMFAGNADEAADYLWGNGDYMKRMPEHLLSGECADSDTEKWFLDLASKHRSKDFGEYHHDEHIVATASQEATADLRVLQIETDSSSAVRWILNELREGRKPFQPAVIVESKGNFLALYKEKGEAAIDAYYRSEEYTDLGSGE